MKKIISFSAAALILSASMTSCFEEMEPQGYTNANGVISKDQAANAPGAFDNFVDAITGTLTGTFIYNNSTNPWNFGYPSLYLQRDMMGQDLLTPTVTGSEWYTGWYTVSGYVTNYASWASYLPWLYYYGWISSCNTVLNLAGPEPAPEFESGVGIAYCMRALYYLDLAQTFGNATYTKDKNGLTVPIVKHTSTSEELAVNPRATNEEMFAFILEDLDMAEKYLANYKRPNLETPDLSVAYGIKARAYLLMGEWAKAKEYAHKAYSMNGYGYLSENELTDQKTAFNNQNNKSWMLCCQLKPTDPNIMDNDADTGWGSQMIYEVGPSGCGYGANYVGPKRIDKHLYESIPYSDYRKKQWIDFKLDELEYDGEAMHDSLLAYTSAAENFSLSSWSEHSVGGVPVKFRPANGEHYDQYAAFTVAIPMMRFEEMKLIEAEAAGRMNEQEGETLLKDFASYRDPEYVYGSHDQDNNYGGGLSQFMRELHWQRRVELWGEGFATFDIKRLGTGIIRNYPGTNHVENYRWNTDGVPAWFNLLITDSEANYNEGIVQNPLFARPTADSEEHKF